LFLLLLLIPTQLGKHFWFDWSLVLGIRVDYLSPVLYLIDLIWIGLFILNLKIPVLKFKHFLILGFVVINILMARDWQIGIYKWLRIGQLVWFVWYVVKNKKLVEGFLVKIIPIWIIIESLLAVGQISKGGSLNGIWWWLGERGFDFNTIGIAQMSIIGNGLVRAYGTFSHPNSLAGFLLVSLVLWWGYRSEIKNKVYWWVVVWLGGMGIILTGSRTIWVLTLMVLILFFRGLRNKWKVGLLILGLLFLAFKIIDYNYPIGNFLGGWDENGMVKRGQLNLAAIGMIRSSPLFGIGLGNFLVNLPEFQRNNQIFWLQPVHNIFLLVVSETGFLGLGILIYFLFEYLSKKKIRSEFILILGIIMMSGMVDHYWLTLPQNMWLLALIVGII